MTGLRMRLAAAVAIAAVLYGIAAGAGVLLYATGILATGATHNDCPDFRSRIADERGIGEHDVSQAEIKQRTQECLDGHELTRGTAFRREFLFWAAWPAAICALTFLFWPAWGRALERREASEETPQASHT